MTTRHSRKPRERFFRPLNDKYFRVFLLFYPSLPFLLSLCFLGVGWFTQSAAAQTECYQINCTALCDNAHGGPGSCPEPAAHSSTFPQNAPITVNIDPAWRNVNGVDLSACVAAAFTNWQNAANNYSGLRFNTITYNSTAATGQNNIQINAPTTIPGDMTAARYTANMTSNGANIYNAAITVDSRATNCTAITQSVAHEIGHLMGLQDCNNCCAGTSVMTPPRCSDSTCTAADFNDTTFGRTTPGGCDVATMNTHYDPTKLNPVQPNPPSAGGGGGSTYNRGDWTGSSCYQWVMVTNYYMCGSSGCTYIGTTYTSYGTFCF